MPWANIVTAAATLIAAYLGAILAQQNQAREFDRQAKEKHRIEQRDAIIALGNAVAAQAENAQLIHLCERRAWMYANGVEPEPAEVDAFNEQVTLATARINTLHEVIRRARLIVSDVKLRALVEYVATCAVIYAQYVPFIRDSLREEEKLLRSKTIAEKHRGDMAAALQLLSEEAAARLSPTYQPPVDSWRRRMKNRWRRTIRRAPTPPASGLPLA